MIDKIGIAIVAAMLSGIVWVPVVFSYCEYQDRTKIRQQVQLETMKRVNEDMSKACKCWFSDSRCTARSTIVVCTVPEFMKAVP